jgi:Zn-dependent oligopeptidase
MPRGKKNQVSLSEQIAALEADIKEKKELLKKLKAQKDEEDKTRLIEAIDASGKSIDDVIAMLQSAGTENE